jgi:hypothetical protein
VLHLPLRPVYVSSKGSALGSQSRRIPPFRALTCAPHHFPSKARALVQYRSNRVEACEVCIWSSLHVVLFAIPVSCHPSFGIRSLVSIQPMIGPPHAQQFQGTRHKHQRHVLDSLPSLAALAALRNSAKNMRIPQSYVRIVSIVITAGVFKIKPKRVSVGTGRYSGGRPCSGRLLLRPS